MAWIAFLYADKMNQPEVGIQYHRKALPYADSLEAIMVWGNMGKTFAKLNRFDSAFYCFRNAFNMIKPGCTEKTLINDVLFERPETKIISYVTDLLIDNGEAYMQQYRVQKPRPH